MEDGCILFFKLFFPSQGCIYWEINSTSLLPVSAEVTRNETCDIDAAIFWKDQLYTFKGNKLN